jgi:hypothetical protein
MAIEGKQLIDPTQRKKPIGAAVLAFIMFTGASTPGRKLRCSHR